MQFPNLLVKNNPRWVDRPLKLLYQTAYSILLLLNSYPSKY